MKNLKYKIFTAVILILFFSVSIILYGNEDGRTGRTLKSSTSGCGSCHGTSAVTDVSVLINGPDTVFSGQTMEYSMTIAKPSKTGAGLDIATRNGSLTPVSSNIHLANGELTHNINIPMSAGTVTVQFNYIAPGFQVIDTLWATGIATNSNGSTDGDDWNWAVSKRIVIKMATGIPGNNTLVNDFRLEQNFPNPFNPVTVIRYSIMENRNIILKVFDASGKDVVTLVDQKRNAGTYEVEFNAGGLPSGVFFYKIIAGDFSDTKSMILIK